MNIKLSNRTLTAESVRLTDLPLELAHKIPIENYEIDLSTRNLPCCGIDRDYNAALNIKSLGMQALAFA